LMDETKVVMTAELKVASMAESLAVLMVYSRAAWMAEHSAALMAESLAVLMVYSRAAWMVGHLVASMAESLAACSVDSRVGWTVVLKDDSKVAEMDDWKAVLLAGMSDELDSKMAKIRKNLESNSKNKE